MREHKFRAWDIDSKQMCYEDKLIIKFDPYLKKELDKEVSFLNSPFVTFTEGGEFIKNYVLMEYTGLKDKNGKEIYEGDILRSEYTDELGEIRLGEYTFDSEHGVCFSIGFYWYENGKDENGVDRGCGLGHDINYSTKKFKVIGNVWENPELLKDTQS